MASPHTEIVDLVERTIGVALMEDQIERTLIPFARDRARALGLWSADVYLRHLRAEPQGGQEWSLLIGAVTNGQTCFFRDAEQFASLKLVLRELANRQPGRSIEIWNSGCSTGEEPYSIAILCAELGITAHIVGSDVNPASLNHAAAACYRAWSRRNVSDERIARWFDQTPDGFRVGKRIRANVRFVRHNLVRDPMLISPEPDGRWHVVLCRNVLIYFRRERVGRVCQRLVGSLVSGGAFVVAASESLSGLDVAARPEMVGSRIVYRKTDTQLVESTLAPRAPAAWRRDRTPPRASAEPTTVDLRPVLDRVARLAIDGDIAAARKLLETTTRQTEPGVEAHLTMGHLHLCEHEFEGALEKYVRAGEIDFLLCEVHYFQGLAHRKRSDWKSAADALRRALFLAPTFWQASYLLAGACQRLGRIDDMARERARTRQLLTGPRPIVTFLSHALFVERFGVSEDEIRRLWAIPRVTRS